MALLQQRHWVNSAGPLNCTSRENAATSAHSLISRQRANKVSAPLFPHIGTASDLNFASMSFGECGRVGSPFITSHRPTIVPLDSSSLTSEICLSGYASVQAGYSITVTRWVSLIMAGSTTARSLKASSPAVGWMMRVAIANGTENRAPNALCTAALSSRAA